ncbi:Mediator complex subunit Med12 [Penicillium hispanicum]|uniref:Mediator complex subunit Med12 n=1 Tax=Penicillium hispanicum TaxID=1080232 RepID=UPI00253FC1FD|nr:Mediator complex subunit Med12 [Penicillium hispanicum]KAJ5594457.1 Mediator complex subunit Med12 [Penicillium hispanicum]
MIPRSSAGGQPRGHPTRVPNGGPGRVALAPTSGQYDPPSETMQPFPPISQSQPQSQPLARQLPIVDLTSGGSEPRDKEHPPKRPKLEVSGRSSMNESSSGANGGETRSTPGSTSSRAPFSWRGRPLWSFQACMSEIPGYENRGDHATDSKPSSPPPFPAQPWSGALHDRLSSVSSRSTEESPKSVQTTPYRIETPSVAPVLKTERVADFTPWTGDHPEDVLNEQTAKQGYYDRTQVSQNESNTARPALYAQLKHRTGLQMLSTVFAAALEKRKNYNTVHAPSTFKPPPRVTLTDNKREAWLRDLANPSVPLRRLSRTIPHGIRGKILLDQCLGKWIPVARAVWLAKCVGANEIRAFKRKGTSGALAVGLEAKWVRDWTANVQQFVEAVLSGPKSSDWKAKMTYAVSLTARLFFENLLDHDHFLEWYLSSFEAASLTTVPVWLLMLGIYWNGLLRYRRRGRRLAELLLEKRRQATDAHSEALQPLIDRLSRFVKKLVHEHTSSIILPNSWETYKHQVSSCLNLSQKVDQALLQTLAERNQRVQRPRHATKTTQRAPNQRIIRLLDSIRSVNDIPTISAACLDVIDDRNALISKLLEWLATPFRQGTRRVYVGVRLLRKWKLSGVDVDDHILAFLTRVSANTRLDVGNIYHAISELVRSQNFSVGRYLQWLMAKGVTSRLLEEKSMMLDLPGDVGLIAQLPIGRLPEHVANLRNILLARLGLSRSDEAMVIANVKELVSRRLPAIFDMSIHAEESISTLPMNLSWAVKAEIGQWLRGVVAEHVRDAKCSTAQVSLPGDFVKSVSALTPDEFYTIRDILETLSDISILADVLRCASSSDDSIVLASVADTTNCHFESLSVIGAATDLFRKLVDTYAGIKRSSLPNLDLIISLIELGLRIPNELNTVVVLRQDLSRMENKAVLAASSPVSDHIPDSFGDSDPLFREKLDQLLLSGSAMDEPTLDMVFNTLTKHLEIGGHKGNVSANDTCRYLAQLRSFQSKHFDGILARWVSGHLRSPDRSTLLRALPSLIGVGCVTIRSLLSFVKRLSFSTPGIPNAADLSADLIDLLVVRSENGKYLDLVSYRFQLAQLEFLSKNSDEVVGIICDAASSFDADNSNGFTRHCNLETSMVMLLQELLVRNPECAEQNCMQKLITQYPAAMGALRKALDLLLDLDSQNNDNSIISEVEKLASTTDDFSLPFCQLKLQVLFLEDSGDNDRNHIADAMFKTVVADSRAHKLHWVDLVALMGSGAIRQIRERAEKELFSIPLLEEPVNEPFTVLPSQEYLQMAKLYLAIIEELAYSVPDSGTPSIAPIIVEKMDTLLQKIISMQSSLRNSEGPRAGTHNDHCRSDFERALAFWFYALLRMVVIHRASFMQLSPTLKVNSSFEQPRLLISIFCIALSRLPGDVLRQFPGADYFPRPSIPENYRPCPGILLQTHALDVAASLIDELPDEIRHQCSRYLREKSPPFVPLQNDTRFLYLLGPVSDVHFSTLVQSTSAPSPTASASNQTPVSTNLPATGPSSQLSVMPSGLCTGVVDGPNSITSRLRVQNRGRIGGPYPIRSWELLEDAAPFVGANDTAVNLGYFDARRVRV